MSSDDGTAPAAIEADRRSVMRALVRPVGATLILLISYFLLPLESDGRWHMVGFAVGGSLLLAFCGWEIRHFLHSERPVAAAVEMLAAIVGFYLVAFSSTYFLLSEYAVAAFTEQLTRVDALYFCLTVFTTTGFGDIAAASQPARVVVSIQMASTLLLLGLGLRFVNVLVQQRLSGPSPDGESGSS